MLQTLYKLCKCLMLRPMWYITIGSYFPPFFQRFLTCINYAIYFGFVHLVIHDNNKMSFFINFSWYWNQGQFKVFPFAWELCCIILCNRWSCKKIASVIKTWLITKLFQKCDHLLRKMTMSKGGLNMFKVNKLSNIVNYGV